VTWVPIFQAPVSVQIRLATVTAAFFLGTWQIFFSTKGARARCTVGTINPVLTTTAIAPFIGASSLPGMRSFHGFTPINRVAPATLITVAPALFAPGTQRLKLHRATMMRLYSSGIGIAGTLASPGRAMHAIALGS
jgi:uncharacterized membrane protein